MSSFQSGPNQGFMRPPASAGTSLGNSANRQSLPPQAYTRDTLVKAINWMQGQSPAVRARATSADLVVSHYLQACRRSDLQSDTPVSGEAFREDLKTLAQDLKMFDEPVAPPQGLATFSVPLSNPTPFSNGQAHVPPPMPQPLPLPPEPTVTTSPSTDGRTWQIDARSWALAQEMQQRLNLSSEIDGLRALITLGAEKARDAFP